VGETLLPSADGGGTIEIGGHARVTAVAGPYGAGIGGSTYGASGMISIGGHARVTFEGLYRRIEG
jgi:hypothetical protein